MNKMLRKALLLGIGTAFITKERVEAFVEELKKEESITPNEGKKLVEDLLKRSKRNQDKLMAEILKQMRSFMKEMPLATKQDLKNLEERVIRQIGPKLKKR